MSTQIPSTTPEHPSKQTSKHHTSISNVTSDTLNLDLNTEKDPTSTQRTSNIKPILYTTPSSPQFTEPLLLNQLSPISHSLTPEIKSTILYLQNTISPREDFSFPKGTILLYFDQVNKTNDFLSLFYDLYIQHKNIQMLHKDKYKFKIANKAKIRSIIKGFKTENQNPILALYTKNNKFFNKIQRTSSTLIIQTQNLTKIPKYRRDLKSKRLSIEYKKAKSAAVHVRRIEYAYHMEIVTHKFKFEAIDKAKIIQCWWRALQMNNVYYFLSSRIQSAYRGRLARVGIGDTLRIVDDLIPFAFCVENIIYRNKVAWAFGKLYNKYGYFNYIKRIPKYLKMIRDKYRDYVINKCIKEKSKYTFTKRNVVKCLLHKFILDGTTLTKLNKLLGHMKGLLVRNNDKTIRKICGYANPYFYYKMKYGKNPELYQKKIEYFHNLFHKLRLLNLKVNHNMNNEFEYLHNALKHEIFTNLSLKAKQLYNNKQLLQSLVNRYNLKKYLHKWNQRARNAAKMEEIFHLPQRFQSHAKLNKLRHEMKKYNYGKFAVQLDKWYFNTLKTKALKKLMKYSKPYTLRCLIEHKIKKYLNKYFTIYKSKVKAMQLVEIVNSFRKRKRFNQWAYDMYKDNPHLFRLKKIRDSMKHTVKRNIKKYFHKWKYNVDNDMNYKLEKYQNDNMKYLRFHLWLNNAKKISQRLKQYKNAITKASAANEKHFLKNALELFFNKWKTQKDIHEKYIKPLQDMKTKMFNNIVSKVVSDKKMLIAKAYFFRTVYILTHLEGRTNITKEKKLKGIVKNKIFKELGQYFNKLRKVNAVYNIVKCVTLFNQKQVMRKLCNGNHLVNVVKMKCKKNENLVKKMLLLWKVNVVKDKLNKAANVINLNVKKRLIKKGSDKTNGNSCKGDINNGIKVNKGKDNEIINKNVNGNVVDNKENNMNNNKEGNIKQQQQLKSKNKPLAKHARTSSVPLNNKNVRNYHRNDNNNNINNNNHISNTNITSPNKQKQKTSVNFNFPNSSTNNNNESNIMNESLKNNTMNVSYNNSNKSKTTTTSILPTTNKNKNTSTVNNDINDNINNNIPSSLKSNNTTTKKSKSKTIFKTIKPQSLSNTNPTLNETPAKTQSTLNTNPLTEKIINTPQTQNNNETINDNTSKPQIQSISNQNQQQLFKESPNKLQQPKNIEQPQTSPETIIKTQLLHNKSKQLKESTSKPKLTQNTNQHSTTNNKTNINNIKSKLPPQKQPSNTFNPELDKQYKLLRKKTLSKLISDISLTNNKTNLKTAFNTIKHNLGLNYKKLFRSNTTINFYSRPKKYIVGKKYRMLKYLINKRSFINNSILKKMYILNWIKALNISKAKTILQQQIIKINEANVTKAKITLIKLHKLLMYYKCMSAVIYLQLKIRKYLKYKKQKQ